jgi:hypothetical protein
LEAAIRKKAEVTVMNKADEGHRLNLLLPKGAMDRLEALKEKTEASSNVEVIKNALRLYEALINDKEDGKEILIRDKNSEGELVSYRIFL